MSTWRLRKARDKFIQMVRCAQSEGPQTITARSEPVAVLVSCADYARLMRPKPGFVEFMRRSPLVGVELKVVREGDVTREISQPWFQKLTMKFEYLMFEFHGNFRFCASMC